MNEEIKNEIQKLKKEKDAVILAHYYVDGEVQEIADYVGDSYYLAEIATKVPESTIVFCGVSFMGESAKILNPKKRVIMADGHADCPMAHMVDVDKIREVRNEYPDVYEDRFVNWIMRKHITKPKWNDHKGKETIRRDEEHENN